MTFTYTYLLSDFLNSLVDLDTLTIQVQDSVITVSLDYINDGAGSGTDVDFYFKATLPSDDIITLNTIVANHTGEPITEETQIVQASILTEHIKYIESGETTQDLYAAESLIIDVSSNDTKKTVDFTWSYLISLMSGTLGISEDMIGDSLCIEIAPNTLIGAFTQNVNLGDTSLNVSPTVLDYVKRGFYIGKYGDMDSGSEMSQVLSIDTENGRINLTSPSISTATAGNYCAMSAKLIPNLYIHSLDKIEIGKQIPTGQRITAGTPVRVCYSNNNNVAKKISFFVEYLY